MKGHNFCEVISIESLRARSELIRTSAMTYLKEEANRENRTGLNQKKINFDKSNKEELPEHEKAVIHLHYWENLSLSEIAGFLGMSYKLVQKIKCEAIHRLRLNYLIEFSQPKEKGEAKTKPRLELVS